MFEVDMAGLVDDLRALKAQFGSEAFPDGATEAEIRDAEVELGFPIDEGYKTLLRFSNGPRIGGDGSIGFFSVAKYGWDKLVDSVDAQFSQGRWVPVTTDGCGNVFALVTLDGVPGRPVGFVEGASIEPQPEYLVASSFQNFLRFWTGGDRGCRMEGWPFDRSLFERFDPAFLASVPERLQPWHV